MRLPNQLGISRYLGFALALPKLQILPSDCQKCRNEDRERCCPTGQVVVCNPAGYSECATPEQARQLKMMWQTQAISRSR